MYDIPASLAMGMKMGDTLLDIALRKKKSAAFLAALRRLGCRTVNEENSGDDDGKKKKKAKPGGPRLEEKV